MSAHGKTTALLQRSVSDQSDRVLEAEQSVGVHVSHVPCAALIVNDGSQKKLPFYFLD
jgi:hypothetical protein